MPNDMDWQLLVCSKRASALVTIIQQLVKPTSLLPLEMSGRVLRVNHYGV